ncbi:COX15/CtaA family protein [Flavihumibacter sp. CACIAM 22H1]|uniref:COX15/CtaA family protein n=1 Tax=Flavihumibacter sp. CACIAM 22H1 TaxID=1812911 RepID=UPI0007A887FD|nr:COX15/CtaA family protein [Flavihumibacter sp. CACIAM 22H1]KYP16375.1 MAG: cytochrome C oxidase assembly protein [Flavihumibacter sp. CACIAM 22H1]
MEHILQFNPQQKGQRAVAIWLLIGVAMIIVQILLGGITRLTGSGLSITEWEVVTGTLPPLNEAAWLEKFSEYQQTPQFRLLNTDFNLPDFKFIFFWEWFHRFWARLIGVVFLVGFVYLSAKRYLKREMVNPLLILFVLGALQGAVGWIMVASGLTGDAVYVKPTRLALHFVLAIGLLCYTFWFALQLLVPARERINSGPVKKGIWLILGLLTLQLLYGALMAGHKAAAVASTWPTINGAWYPDGMGSHQPWLINFIDNTITVHFIHRNLAYLITILIIVWYRKASQEPLSVVAKRYLRWPLLIVVIQVLLGILAVLTSKEIIPNRWGSFEWMAQIHQLTAMFLVLSLVGMLYLFSARRQQA